jgi:hypothetical protein
MKKKKKTHFVKMWSGVKYIVVFLVRPLDKDQMVCK